MPHLYNPMLNHKYTDHMYILNLKGMCNVTSDYAGPQSPVPYYGINGTTFLRPFYYRLFGINIIVN